MQILHFCPVRTDASSEQLAWLRQSCCLFGILSTTVGSLYICTSEQMMKSRVQVNDGQKYQVQYACSCCGLFGGGDDCCQPLSSCSYLTPSCGSAKPITQAYYVSPFPHSLCQ